ncbi:Mobile element protein [Hyphomicrobium sulfonivorans]|uniref:Mobile element protein n=1 Tax=Hyphomicrobium sulfonivorans TaxID=121290 RepID=A0A109BGQ9_HYPSL|nr:Mobile element protein [Hyphomicrobium sulfonivorans]
MKALPRACTTAGREFLEAGKRRLAGDTARSATTNEVKDLRREARELRLVLSGDDPR